MGMGHGAERTRPTMVRNVRDSLRLNYRYTGEASFAGGVGALLDHQLPPFKRVNARLQ